MSEDIRKDNTGVSAASASTIGQQAFSSPTGPPPAYVDRELPPGWVKQFDRKSERSYYVDTMAKPPRSIWVHPFDDPQFLASITDPHQDVSDDDDHSVSDERHTRTPSPSPSPGSFKPDTKGRPSEANQDSNHLNVPGAGASSSSRTTSQTSAYPPTVTNKDMKQKDRGFFGKLLGNNKSKEERAAIRAAKKQEKQRIRDEREQRRREEERRYIEARTRLLEERRRQYEAEMEAYRRQGQAPPGYGGYGNSPYGAPHPGAYGGPVYMPQYGYGESPYNSRSRGGGGGALLGGLLGGLLLGDLLF